MDDATREKFDVKLLKRREIVTVINLGRNICTIFSLIWYSRQNIYAGLIVLKSGRDSSVGIATRYGLDAPAIESRWGARFSTPVQTGLWAHPASYTMGTGSF